MQNTNRNDKLYIRTYREIRKYIVQNNLQPGDLLPTEQKLCETLGVSRNVLRESIKSMELMGMVRACPGKGTEVQAFNLDFILQNVLFFQVGPQEEHSIREMFGVRKVLELAYMRQAFHAMTEEDVRALRSLADAMRDNWSRGVFFIQEDKNFHLTLFRSLHNDVLLSLLEAIWSVDDGFELEKKQPHLEQTVTKHEAIIAALENHSYPAFARAMEAHFSSGKYLGMTSYEEF